MSNSRYMLDASAVLTMMLGEEGADEVRTRLASSQISSVNLSEVVAKLQEGGVPDEVIQTSVDELDFDILIFDQEQARIAGLMRTATRAAGLSLGDRACLAAASFADATAVTTDRAWSKLELGIAIELVR